MNINSLIKQDLPHEIRKYISLGESEALEFKKSTGEWKEIIKMGRLLFKFYYCAMKETYHCFAMGVIYFVLEVSAITLELS